MPASLPSLVSASLPIAYLRLAGCLNEALNGVRVASLTNAPKGFFNAVLVVFVRNPQVSSAPYKLKSAFLAVCLEINGLQGLSTDLA